LPISRRESFLDGPIPGPYALLSFAIVAAGRWKDGRLERPANLDMVVLVLDELFPRWLAVRALELFRHQDRIRREESIADFGGGSLEVSFGAPKPATHRRPKPATMWGVLVGRIVLFGSVGKGRDQVVGF